MKTSTGYVFIVFLMIVFMILLSSTMHQANNVKSIETVLESEVHINSIKVPQNSYIYDKNGERFSTVKLEENRKYIDYEDIPELVIQAFLSTEDQQFYEHKGVDISSIVRALIVNARSNDIEEGASTLTQQVVRNIYLSHEQTYNRKLSEVLYSYQIEKDYSKSDILELYINTIYFNNGIYGFETASQTYFGKSSKELTLAELSFLAAIPANPSHYDPLTNKENTHLRQQWILNKMVEAEVITEEDMEKALLQNVEINFTEPSEHYPDYAHYIEHELKQLIASKEGYQQKMDTADEKEKVTIQKELKSRVHEILQSGVHIETSMDPVIQEQAAANLNDQLNRWNVQGAAVIIDHAKNSIAAMSGGRDYQKYDFNRAFQAFRQPGSTIKPLLVFGPYIDQTQTSLKTHISTDQFCRNDYCPSNAGGGYYGSTTIENAFAQSYNTVAVRLFDQVGISTAFSYLEKFGFSQMEPEDYSHPAAIGGFSHGMSPLELTRAYTVFSNDGHYTKARGIKQVKDNDGNVLYEWNNSSEPIWEEETNDKLRTMLQKAVTDGTGRYANIPGDNIGGKTGTTNDTFDLWFVGYNDRFTTGVWIGQDTPATLKHIQPSRPHLSLWKDIVSHLPQ
ncbi:transglycosylase domain-containing protein [Alteribacillus sp. YIM 98480]|uniref:transglycosylase domain-containing protein n=1 Tax=Alteribacillus sp. YIM 98480 TaxID=2606599 RepID=UPI00131C1AF4|nr:transglycosylase domain-containing protein [Alteribacillus sp. YIM 98480]